MATPACQPGVELMSPNENQHVEQLGRLASDPHTLSFHQKQQFFELGDFGSSPNGEKQHHSQMPPCSEAHLQDDCRSTAAVPSDKPACESLAPAAVRPAQTDASKVLEFGPRDPVQGLLQKGKAKRSRTEFGYRLNGEDVSVE